MNHPTFESPIDFNEDKVNYLIVECQKQLSKYVAEINSQIQSMDGSFTLSDADVSLDFSRSVELIIDPFSLDPNNKKLINSLLMKMKSDAFGERHYLQTDEMISVVLSTVNSFIKDQNQSVSISEGLDMVALFRTLGVGFEYSSESLIENICEYLSISKDYSQVKIYIFVNLRCLLSNDEIQELYKFILYNKIETLMIENHSFDPSGTEFLKIIDEDLCEITQRFQNY